MADERHCGVSTSAIRALVAHEPLTRKETVALCDALDAARAEIDTWRIEAEEAARLRAGYLARAEKAELDARNNLRERNHAHREVADRTAERDDARARLAEIRALCDEREDAFRRAAGDWEHTEEAIALNGGVVSTQRVRAVLDREAGDP